MEWKDKRWDKQGGDGRCRAAEAFGKWCTQDFYPTLKKRPGYAYVSPTIYCEHQNKAPGSCEWNGLPKAANELPSDGDLTILKTQTFLGSTAILAKLCAIEREVLPPEGKQAALIPILRKGDRLQVFSRPEELNILVVNRAGAGDPQRVLLGRSGAGLRFISQERVGDRILWTYQDETN